jgi:hypothetical protein
LDPIALLLQKAFDSERFQIKPRDDETLALQVQIANGVFVTIASVTKAEVYVERQPALGVIEGGADARG